MKLEGRCALVTGAATGIGEAYAHALAREGTTVVIADVDADGAQRVASDISEEGARAAWVEVDVADEVAVEAVVADLDATWGGFDVLVNNAGLYMDEYSGPCAALERSKWRRLIDVNLTGALNCASAVRPGMAQRGGGVIINQSSVGAYTAGTTAYGVSKRALNALTVCLAEEFAPDRIRVNGIAPSSMESDSRPALRWWPEERRREFFAQQLVDRVGHFDDLCNALVFLCSDDASFITAETLRVDGGLTRIL
ncbi:glucose 1-dehydrogenase [Myxococcota bacterium]|nr:glucose 1-dehydrogenase [Myxococcota bacterium]